MKKHEATNVTINGEARSLEPGSTLADLLRQLGLGGRLAIERNGEIVPRSLYGETRLAAGDKVEIVRAIGGG